MLYLRKTLTEAWYDGLDIVAITDHYEGTTGIRRALKIAAPINGGKPFEYKYTRELGKACADFNAIHKEAVMRAKKGGFPMLIVKGCEMGREPKEFGHFNCLFVKDLLLSTKTYLYAPYFLLYHTCNLIPMLSTLYHLLSK